jgi:glucosylceramidase
MHDPSTGEVSSTALGGEVCLTTGWPFLQVGGFEAKAANVAVILNEASESANYVFRNKGKTVVTASIPPHSIQTLTFADH